MLATTLLIPGHDPGPGSSSFQHYGDCPARHSAARTNDRVHPRNPPDAPGIERSIRSRDDLESCHHALDTRVEGHLCDIRQSGAIVEARFSEERPDRLFVRRYPAAPRREQDQQAQQA